MTTTMRRVAAFGLACALVLAAPRARAQPAPAVEPVTTRTLANGITVVVVADDAVAVVRTALWIRYGAADEPTGKAGLARALARMFVLDSPTLSAAGLDDVTARTGATATATASNDYSRFTFDIPSDRYDLALRILADRMQNLALDDAHWNAAKTVLLKQRVAAAGDALGELDRAVCRAATPTATCGTAALGSSDDIASLTVDDVRAAYRAAYVPGNATLVIAGDVPPLEAFARAEAAFGAIPTATVPVQSSVEQRYAHDVRVTLGSAPYGTIDLTYPAPGSTDARAGAFSILDALLTDPTSEVSRALVDSGYATSIATRLDRNVRGSLYHVFVTVARNHASAPSASALLAAVARLRDRGITDAAVLSAKAHLIRRAADAGDSLDGIADSVGYAIAVENVAGPGIDTDRIETTSAADVAAAARIFLKDPAATGFLAVGPTGDGERATLPPDTVTDDFGRRRPSGKVVEPPWIRGAIAKPVGVASRVRPEGFALPNGLRVLVQPVRTNPTVFVSGTVETSPHADARGREGTGALAARLLAYGGAKYDVAARRGVADSLGARFEFGFTFRAHGRAGDLRALLDVLADALESPTFASDDVERIRGETRDALANPDPDETAARAFDRLFLRRGDPETREPSDASLRAISVEDLLSYARRNLRPDVTTIAIAGDVDAANVRDDVEATFGEWRSDGRTPDVSRPRYAKPQAERRLVRTAGETIDVRVGTPLVARGSRDYNALDVLVAILAARRYPPSEATLEADRFRGRLVFRLSTAGDRFSPAVAALRKELQGLQHGRPTSSELNRAKSKALADRLVAEQSTETIAERVREIGLDRLPLNIETKRPARLAAVRASDVAHVARVYLHPNALIEVDEGPHP